MTLDPNNPIYFILTLVFAVAAVLVNHYTVSGTRPSNRSNQQPKRK